MVDAQAFAIAIAVADELVVRVGSLLDGQVPVFVLCSCCPVPWELSFQGMKNTKNNSFFFF